MIWADKRVFDSQRATSTAGVAAGDQLPTRRTRSLPPEPSSCLSAGHYDRLHLANGRVELCFIEAAYEKVKFCGDSISDAGIAIGCGFLALLRTEMSSSERTTPPLPPQ